MKNQKYDSEAETQDGIEKAKTASQKSGLIQAIRRSLTEPTPSIKAIDALAEVQSPAPEPQPHESVREAGIAGGIYKFDDQVCGGPTR